MKTEKLSLSGIKNVLSRAELKKIMAGSGGCVGFGIACNGTTGNTCCEGYYCNGAWGGGLGTCDYCSNDPGLCSGDY